MRDFTTRVSKAEYHLMVFMSLCLKTPGAIAVAAILMLTIGIQTTAHSLNPQGDGIIRLIVNSEVDGSPIIGATVILRTKEDDQEIAYGGSTNIDGFVELRGIAADAYLLEVSYIGYETYTEEIELAENQRLVKQVRISPAPGRLDEITIIEERQVTTGQVGVRTITGAEIDRAPTPGPGGDFASYLQTIPGVVMAGDRGGQLHIRGGTPAQNYVLVDNLPIIKPFHISNMFSAFPQEIIRSVDLYAGGFGSEYMGATSSIIDVTLRQGNMRNHSGSVAYSPYLASFHGEGPIETDRQSLLMMGRYSVIEQMGPHLTGQDVPLQFQDLMMRYTLQTDNLNCSATGMFTYDRGQINPERDYVMSWSNRVIGGKCMGYDETYDHPYELTFGYTGFTNNEGEPGNPHRTSNFHNIRLQLLHQYTILGHPVEYRFGINLANYNAALSERFTGFDSFNTAVMISQNSISTEWSPSEQLTIHPGIGSQISSQNVVTPTLEPRLRVAYRPGRSANHEVSLALGRYYQVEEGITDERDAGTVFTIWSPSRIGDPLPSATHGILGYQYRFGRVFEFNIEGYAKNHRNLPVSKWNPEAKMELDTGLADGTSYGFDLRAELEIYPFYFSAGYGWSEVEYEATSDDLGAWIEEPVFGYHPAHDRRHQLNAILSYRFAGFSTNIRWEFGSGRPYTQVYGYDLRLTVPQFDPTKTAGRAYTYFHRPYGARLPTYHSLDISVERTFSITPQLSLDAEIGTINAYNRNNIFYFDLTTLQRIDQTPILPYASISAAFN